MMIRTQISFDKRLYRLAQIAARKEGVSLAELCRRGLKEILLRTHKKERWMDHLGSMASGDPRASTSVDEVVYNRPCP